jgi:DNA polymerase III delta prime subunit
MISAAERQARSERAKRMHAEGRLGSSAVAKRAAQKSAEVRQERSVAAIAQRLYVEHEDDVKKALLHALRHGTVAQRLKASEILTRSGLSAQRTEQAERRDEVQAASTLTRDQLLERLAAGLTTGAAGAMLRARIDAPEVVDAELVEEG